MNIVKNFQLYLEKIKREKYLTKEINKSLTMNKREFVVSSQYGVINDIFVTNKLDYFQNQMPIQNNYKKCNCCGNIFVGNFCPICSTRH